jgi:hypothetical protein
VVVGYPQQKAALLPERFVILEEPTDLTKIQKAIAFIDEADIQLPIEDTKAREHVINFLSLPRHRDMIFLLAFHFPRLVMGRYLPFFSAFLLKRPPYLIDYAGKSKGDILTEMMKRSEERFAELPSEEVVKHTYVVAPRIRWQGMLQNPLCSFWCDDLSKVWAGTEVEEPQVDMFKVTSTIITPEMKKRAVKVDNGTDKRGPEWLDPFTNISWVEELPVKKSPEEGV